MNQEKTDVRKQALQARKALGAFLWEEKSRAIAEFVTSHQAFARAKTIMSYSAIEGEVQTSFIENAAKAMGKTVAWPVCLADRRMAAAVPRPGGWVLSKLGIMEPDLAAADIIAPGDIDLIIVPGVAFGRDFMRVGFGGGYYDRYLPLCTRAHALAVCFGVQLFDSVPFESWDRPMDSIVTEKEIIFAKN